MEKVFVLETTAGTTAITMGLRRHLRRHSAARFPNQGFVGLLLLVHSRKPARHLKTGPRSQKVGLVSITKVFWGSFTSSNSPA